jgi:hypothetical protein
VISQHRWGKDTDTPIPGSVPERSNGGDCKSLG